MSRRERVLTLWEVLAEPGHSWKSSGMFTSLGKAVWFTMATMAIDILVRMM